MIQKSMSLTYEPSSEQGNALGALDLVDYLEELADAPGRRLIPPGAVRRAMASR